VLVVVIEKRTSDPAVAILQFTGQAERFEPEQDI
jgi:hypothetical protein